MERTTSEMASHGNAPHMGLLRSQIERRGRRSLKGYAKRFWVVNERSCRLEVYRNDQEHVPLQVFRASDIRNVYYADDKQNRFFVMIVQNRGPRDIKFRMGSFEERDAWMGAITRIMDIYTTTNKHKNVLNMVLRRANAVSDSLGVKITIDAQRLLAEVPDDLLQYVAEAVDIALASVTAIVRAYSGDVVDMPRNYILYVHASNEEHAMSLRRGPQYNPAGRTMTLNVCLLRTNAERVIFAVTQPEEVFRLMQSNVFRNPVIEGWIETEPNCARACADIQEYLGVPADKKGWITFQWGQHVSNGDQVEAFLQRFVTADFFERALTSVKDGVARVERLIADTIAQASFKSAANASLAATLKNVDGAGSPRGPRGPVAGAGSSATTVGQTGASTATAAATSASELAGPSNTSNTGVPAIVTGALSVFSHSRQASVSSPAMANSGSDAALAIKLIRENITGLCIPLEKRAVEVGNSPPTMSTVHTSDYEQHCRPAFLLVTKCRRGFPGQLSSTGDSLSDELYGVAFNAFLQMQLSLLRTDLNGIFPRQVKVVVMWDHLFRAAADVELPVRVQDLPHTVRHVRGVCLLRLQHMAQVLRHSQAQVTGATIQADESLLYAAFCSCVSVVVIDFAGYASSGAHHDVKVFEPSLSAGVLTDTLYCVKEESIHGLMVALRHTHRGGGGGGGGRSTVLTSSYRGVHLYAAEPKLGGWCENYFSNPEHAVPVTVHQQVEDEFDTDSDDGTVGTLQAADFGEAVAYERSAEIQLLTMQRVVNAIYDSQRRAPVDLKIGSDDIVKAIRAFASAFGKDKWPSKHDVARVLILNLQRLRQMYVRAVDDETTSLLTWGQARQFLRDFCEYETNERYVDEELRKVSMTDTLENRSSSAAPSSSSTTSAATPPVSVSPSSSPERSRSHEPIAGAAVSHEDSRVHQPDAQEEGSAPLRTSSSAHCSPTSPSLSAMNQTSLSPSNSNIRGSRRSLGMHFSVSRRRYSISNIRQPQPQPQPQTGREGHSLPETLTVPASSGSPLDATPQRSTLPASPLPAKDAYDFASVSEVALTKLLPREARLARLAWRVGLVFGLENTGKTLIINSMQGIARPTVATVGMSQHVVAFEEWVWALNELGGRESFRSNWRYYVRRMEEVHFLVFVLDVLNSQARRDTYMYLKEVTKHYRKVPLVVIFNNFREGHRRFDITEYESLVKLDKLRAKHHAEVLACVCDITVVHSKNKQLPPALDATFRRLSSLLMAQSKEHLDPAKIPPAPKTAAISGGASAVGGGGGGVGSNVSFVFTPRQSRATPYTSPLTGRGAGAAAAGANANTATSGAPPGGAPVHNGYQPF